MGGVRSFRAKNSTIAEVMVVGSGQPEVENHQQAVLPSLGRAQSAC